MEPSPLKLLGTVLGSLERAPLKGYIDIGRDIQQAPNRWNMGVGCV